MRYAPDRLQLTRAGRFAERRDTFWRLGEEDVGDLGFDPGVIGRDPSRGADPAGEHCRQVLDPQRLGQVVVHARRQAPLAITPQCAGRQGNNGRPRRICQRFAATKLGCCLVAIELRHLAIHEHARVGSAIERIEGSGAAVNRVCLVAQLAQQTQRNALVHSRVFDHQYASRGNGPDQRV